MDSVLKILDERITQLIDQGINYKGVYRTEPAEPDLLNTVLPGQEEKTFSPSRKHTVPEKH